MFEGASVPFVGSAFCGEGHVAELREFGIVIECRNFGLGDPL
jgi:hypothetical protein